MNTTLVLIVDYTYLICRYHPFDGSTLESEFRVCYDSFLLWHLLEMSVKLLLLQRDLLMCFFPFLDVVG